uniref:Uncharacterized protein n=1 Tax=Arundo donax TaxID=35708 RepID=A0A0A9FW92_ARUDO
MRRSTCWPACSSKTTACCSTSPTAASGSRASSARPESTKRMDFMYARSADLLHAVTVYLQMRGALLMYRGSMTRSIKAVLNL